MSDHRLTAAMPGEDDRYSGGRQCDKSYRPAASGRLERRDLMPGLGTGRGGQGQGHRTGFTGGEVFLLSVQLRLVQFFIG